LIDIGFDPAFGARPLKRAIQKYVMDPLAMALIEGRVTDGSQMMVTMQDGKVVVK
jgi:ATP-dependent Clp protease ATP-binding subunit ClpB